MFDLKKFYWRRKCGIGFDRNHKGQAIHGDALYFRDPDYYLSMLLEEGGKNIKERLLKSVVIALFFGYSDYAILLLEKAKSKKVIPINEFFSISTTIRKNSQISISLPNFKGKGLLGQFFSIFIH